MSATRGFTLIELLVAISLATIITLLGVSLMRTSINSSVNNQEALIQHQAIRDVQRLIEYAWSERQSSDFAVTENQVEFLSGRKALGQLPLRFVCQTGHDGGFALWFYRVTPPADSRQAEEPSGAPTGEMLLGGLTACQFGFLEAPPDDRLPAQWKQAWPAGQGPPELMRLDLGTALGALPPFIFGTGGT